MQEYVIYFERVIISDGFVIIVTMDYSRFRQYSFGRYIYVKKLSLIIKSTVRRKAYIVRSLYYWRPSYNYIRCFF